MRLTLLATLVAVVATTMSVAPASTSEARPAHRGRAKPVLTLGAGAPTYLDTDTQSLTFSFLHKKKGARLQLQQKQAQTNAWRAVQNLPHTKKKHRGGGTVTLGPQTLGDYSYRVAVLGRRGGVAASSPELSVRVFGPVPIVNLIAATPASYSNISSGRALIGGTAFPYTFWRTLTGAESWRTVISLPATSCNGIGIPLASRHHGASTGGTFSMRAITTDSVIAQNAVPQDVAAGLLVPVPVGGALGVQVRSDVAVDYFGSGQAICYTIDGRA
jgi:hypothetical protein